MIAETSTPPAPVARARRVSRLVALAGAAVLALAGCGAGQISETSRQHPTVGGSNVDLGRIALRNMQIEAPTSAGWAAGDTVALTMTIINNTTTAEDLIGISSDAAQDVKIFADSAEYLAYLASLAPGAPAPAAAPAPASVTTEPSATAGSGSQAPTPISAVTPTPISAVTPTPISAVTGRVTVPSNSAVQFGYGAVSRPIILLVGLTEHIAGGSVVNLDFTFATAGSVTAPVPVMLTPGGASDSPTLNLHHGGAEATEEEH